MAYDPYVSAARAAQLGIELLSLDDLLGRADFISVHLPKTPETAGLIDKEALAKTKPGVIIVNAARGGLVDEAALADAITSGHVRAAGIDVYSKEPCTDSPLFELPQVVVTPHLGASTEEAQDRAGTDVAASVKLALAGEFVPDAVNVGGGVGQRRSGALAGPGPQARSCWPVRSARNCRRRCRCRFAVSWPAKTLRCCGFRRCADCSRRSSRTR